MPQSYTFPSYLQPNVYAPTGSDLYNQRVAYNQSKGVKSGGVGLAGSAGVETGIASSVNQFMQGQAGLGYLMNLPGYQGMRGQQSENILSQLQGDVPDDVVNQILTRAAERGISTGTSGAPASNSTYLRALGLTSLDMQKQGSEGLSRAIEQTPVAEPFNPMSLYVPERLGKMQLNAAKEGASGGTGNPWLDNYESRFGSVNSPVNWTGWRG
jgi:hypothetical protein